MTDFGRNAGNGTQMVPVQGGGSALKTVIIVLVVLAVIIGVPALIIGGMLASANNRANGYERKLETKYEDVQNVLSQYSNKIVEMAQVPAQYKKDLTELVKAEMEGRYGDPTKTRNVLANWVQERDLNFDSGLYVTLQREMSIGRTAFGNAQTEMLDIKREYETALGNFPGGIFMKMVGYPAINLSKFRIVKSGHAIESFETGVEKPVQAFPQN